MMKYLTTENKIATLFMEPYIIDRFTAMLDYNLAALVGPRCTELKVLLLIINPIHWIRFKIQKSTSLNPKCLLLHCLPSLSTCHTVKNLSLGLREMGDRTRRKSFSELFQSWIAHQSWMLYFLTFLLLVVIFLVWSWKSERICGTCRECYSWRSQTERINGWNTWRVPR